MTNNFKFDKEDLAKAIAIEDESNCDIGAGVQYKSNQLAICFAENIKRISALNNLWWAEPLINSDEDFILLEWWNKSRKISFYITEAQINFIQIWGSDIDNEMKEGAIQLTENFKINSEQILLLWRWIS